MFLEINGCYCCKVGLKNNKIIDENRKITILDGGKQLIVQECEEIMKFIPFDIDKKPVFVIDFSKVKDVDKKIKFIFLTKPIECDKLWCWMIYTIQSLFSVPAFFEYIANVKFEDPIFIKLKKLQELLLKMIHNQTDPSTSYFSKEKFITYYNYFINDGIIKHWL